MLFGSQINPTILGSNPVIPGQVEKGDNLPMQFDFRSVYASIFKEWFEAEEKAIEQVLFDQFETLPILKRTAVGIPDREKEKGIRLFPNPVHNFASVEFITQEKKVVMQLFSSNGRQLETLFSRSLESGKHQVSIDFSHLFPGAYYLNYSNGLYRKSIPFIKL